MKTLTGAKRNKEKYAKARELVNYLYKCKVNKEWFITEYCEPYLELDEKELRKMSLPLIVYTYLDQIDKDLLVECLWE